MDSENFKIKLLDSDNWHQWNADIKVLLIDRGSWDFITDEEPKLDETATRKEKADYNMRKNRAYTTIYQSIKPQFKNLISETTEGKKAYEILKEYFQPKTRATTIALLDEFFSLRFDKNSETIGLFGKRLKVCVQRLADAGHALDELFQGFQLIRFLPSEYNGIVQIIYRWKDPEFTYDNILKELILEENRLKQLNRDAEKEPTEHGAYMIKKKPKRVSQNKSSNKNKITDKKKVKKGLCFRCKAKGHYYYECPQIKNKIQQPSAPNVEILNNQVNISTDKLNWCLDSGATHHFSNNKELFTDFTELKDTKMILAVGNAESVVEGCGTVNFFVKGCNKIISQKCNVLTTSKTKFDLHITY